MWDALQEVASREKISLHDLCTAVARKRGLHSMTAAIRVYLLNYFRVAATDAGHRKAGQQRWDVIDDHEAYLRRAVTNRAYNATRNRGRRAEKARRVGLERTGDVPEPEYLGDLIAALPARQRAVVVLRFHLDLSYDEIAASLGIRSGSVGPTLQRALRALDQELRP